MKVFFDMITLRDAHALRAWWQGNSCGRHNYAIRRSPSNPRFWALYREDN